MKCPTAVLSKPCRLGETFLLLFDVMKCIATIHLKNVDQGSGQVVDPELAVGGGGRSAVAQRAMAGQAKKRSIHGSM